MTKFIAYARCEQWPLEDAKVFLRLPLAEQKDCAWDLLMLGTAIVDASTDPPRRVEPFGVQLKDHR